MNNPGIDPRWSFYLGIAIIIETAIGQGAVPLTNTFPAEWIPYIKGWSQLLSFVGQTVQTALIGYSSRQQGPLVSAAPTVTPTIVKVLLIAFALSFLVAGGEARAQGIKLKPLTGDVAKDFGIGDKSVLTGNPSKDLIALYGKLQAVSLVDLKYALNIANKKNNLAAGQCWTAIITQIEQDQTANLDDKGQPLPTPDPHLFTDVERLSDVINSLGPNSPLMVGCGSFANQAKMNVLQLISTIMAGGAGLAALAP